MYGPDDREPDDDAAAFLAERLFGLVEDPRSVSGDERARARSEASRLRDLALEVNDSGLAERAVLAFAVGASVGSDERDYMVALSSYRIVADLTAVNDVPRLFELAADLAPETERRIIRSFGRRTDVTPEAFGFRLEGRRLVGWGVR
jgi:hypothetical protein